MIHSYNKLVRDKIPAIIEAGGTQTCTVRQLSESEYLDSLNLKLQEEVAEYLESGDIEELVDIEEVLRAILSAKKVSAETFEDIRETKVVKRGAFHQRLFLIDISSPE